MFRYIQYYERVNIIIFNVSWKICLQCFCYIIFYLFMYFLFIYFASLVCNSALAVSRMSIPQRYYLKFSSSATCVQYIFCYWILKAHAEGNLQVCCLLNENQFEEKWFQKLMLWRMRFAFGGILLDVFPSVLSDWVSPEHGSWLKRLGASCAAHRAKLIQWETVIMTTRTTSLWFVLFYSVKL